MKDIFYTYLKQQFKNLEEAKIWAKKWCREWEQDISNHPEWGFTSRAMATHISCVLEGYKNTPKKYYNTFGTNYLTTKYGVDIYQAMWS